MPISETTVTVTGGIASVTVDVSRGLTGATGATGPAGSDASVTNANVNAAIATSPATTRGVLELGTAATSNTGDFELSPAHVYVLPFFETSSEKLQLAISHDGQSFRRAGRDLFSGVNNTVRDPSFYFGLDGWVYLAYTPNSFAASQSLYIARSRNLLDWSNYATIDFSSVGGVNQRIWSPKWFVDTDGSINIVVACNEDYSPISDFKIYLVTASSDDLSAWGVPSLLFDDYEAIDPFLIEEVGTYYLFYKNESTTFIEVATSSSLNGTYTRIQSGDWTGWGAGVEGFTAIRRGSGDYLYYADKYAANTGMHYATSASLVSVPSALTQITRDSVDSLTVRHGSPLLISDPRNIPQIVALHHSLANRPGTFNRLRTKQVGGAGTYSAAITTGTDQYSDNTSLGWDVVDPAGTPLGRIEHTRVSQSTGESVWRMHVWDGSSLVKIMDVGSSGGVKFTQIFGVTFHINGSSDRDGNGSPEGVISAVVGSTYRRRDGGAGTCFYVKESGTGNTGWIAK